MRAIHIKIENLKAFASFESGLPTVCILQGNHGVGKSSFEEILKYCMGRRPLADKGSRGVEHDPGMLRIGAERGFAEVRFDESSSVELLRVVVTSDSTKRETKTRGSKKWVAAAAEIDAFAEAISYDPMTLKKMSAKERVAALLKVMPIEVSASEVAQAMNGVGVQATIFKMPPSLDAINAAYSDIEGQRRDLNRDVKSLRAHAEELESALPPEAGTGKDWGSVAAGLDARIATLRKTEADSIQRLTAEVSTVKDTQSRVKAAEHSAIDSDINGQIAALERQRAERKEKTSRFESDIVDKAREKANKDLVGVRAEINPEVQRLTAEAATARARADAQQRTIGAREAATKAKATAQDKAEQSERMTEAMDKLAKLKSEVAGRMKIPGLTIESAGPGFEVDACRLQDGKLVPFSIWNDSDQDLACLKVAVIARGPYGLVCVDSLGEYTEERRAGVLAAAKKYAAEFKMQFVFGEAVDGKPLTVVDATEEVPA